MLQKILSILGWVGTALVFVAVAVRLLGASGTLTIQPEQDRYITWAAYAGLALVILYTLGQWREIVAYFQRRRQARYGAIAGTWASSSRLPLSWRSIICPRGRTSAGT